MNDAREDDDIDDGAADEDMVPLGDVIVALDAQRAAAVDDAARHALKATRTPPHAMDAERAVLGAILLDPACYDDVVEAGLVADDFYRQHHGTIFAVVADLRAAGEPADTVTVVDELLRRKQLDAVGGAAAVSQLEAALPTAAHAGTYARLVHEKALLRRVIANATKLVASAFAQDRPVAELLEQSQSAFADLTVGRRNDVANRAALVREIMEDIGKPGRAGLSTGWQDLDDGLLQRGIRHGQFIIVGARPAMGKTAFGAQLAANNADMGVKSVFFTMEMTPRELLERELAGRARLAANTWKRELGTGRLQKAAGHIADRELDIVHCPGATLGTIGAQARRLVAKGVGLIVIDHLGLIAGSGKYDNRTQEVGEISRGLKALAGELMVPIVCLSQLNRKVETRGDKRPELSDLRDTGDIEQDADVVLFLHRPEYYLKEKTPEDLRNIAEVIVAKQRNGPTGVGQLWYEGEHTRFRSVEASS